MIIPEKSASLLNHQWQDSCRFFEYSCAANPCMPDILIDVFPAKTHQVGETRTIPLDLSKQLHTPYPATGPSLLANFVHIVSGDTHVTETHASSQIFYVIRGKGSSVFPEGVLFWKKGDYIALPSCGVIEHYAEKDSAFYWVNDQPLMDFLGVHPQRKQCQPLYFSAESLESELQVVTEQIKGKDNNRNGVLLANPDCPLTKTVTHSMWSLYNLLPAKSRQKAHRHNSIALDFAVKAQADTYTLIGRALDESGNIVDPVRVDWQEGGAFVTPPGWWHSHHNESEFDAIVLPVQDAGLHTYVQSLDIQFSDGY